MKIGFSFLSKSCFMKGIVLLSSFFVTLNVYSNPVLNNVASGNVSVQQTQNSTVVNQSSQKAIINWNSFNIGAQESTHFQQPAGGAALNRINPAQGVSQIYGSLTATGQIILINPAGIHFGVSAHVNVGGLIATTANMYRWRQVSFLAFIRPDAPRNLSPWFLCDAMDKLVMVFQVQ